RVVEVHLRVHFGDSQRGRHFGEGQVAVDAQEQDLALPPGEPCHGLAQRPLLLCPGDALLRAAGFRARLQLRGFGGAVESRDVAEMVLRQVDHDAEEPRLERAAAPTLGALAGIDEGALGQVFRVVLVAREAARDGQHRALVAAHERPEGVPIARAERSEQLGIAQVAHPTGTPLAIDGGKSERYSDVMLELKWVVANLEEARRRIATRGPAAADALAPIESLAAERRQLIMA